MELIDDVLCEGDAPTYPARDRDASGGARALMRPQHRQLSVLQRSSPDKPARFAQCNMMMP
jgi:hypothetical protein